MDETLTGCDARPCGVSGVGVGPGEQVGPDGVAVHGATVADPLPVPRLPEIGGLVPTPGPGVGDHPAVAERGVRQLTVLVLEVDGLAPAVIARTGHGGVAAGAVRAPVVPPVHLAGVVA